MTTGQSPRAYGYSHILRPTYAVAGYDGWWYTDPPGEDDGVLAYDTQYGTCNSGSYWGDWRGHVPSCHFLGGNFYNAWQSDMDHFEAKASGNHTMHKLATSPLYSGGENDGWQSNDNPEVIRTYAF